MTAGGHVEVHRTYFCCQTCHENEFPCDRRLGIEGKLTTRTRKLSCMFGIAWGFEKAAQRLNDACGVRLSAQTIKRCCYAEGKEVEDWRAEQEATSQFEDAPGELEFQSDGTMANTVEGGWKEVKLAAFIKRENGAPAAAHEWDQRKLPEPSAVSVRVSMESAEEFAKTWRPWAASLGILAFVMVTVIGDGAKWIWNQTRIHFPTAGGLLDIYHLIEKVAEAVRKVHGDNAGATNAWVDSATRALLLRGWTGICDWIGRFREEHPDQAVKPTEELIRYLSSHTKHLDYPARLASGQSIGSGRIEGACKYVVGRRIKRTGGRWRITHLSRMATLCSSEYAGDWNRYWESCLSLAA